MKVLSAVAGLVLMTSAITLAYLSSNNGSEMLAKKDAVVEKYILQSQEALKSGSVAKAIHNAKLAIAADPKSKKGFKAYESIIESKYKPADTVVDTTTVATPQKPKVEEEAMPDMGC